MKKILLLFSSLLLFISCDNNENTPEPSIIKEEVPDDMIGGTPDPSFLAPMIQTRLYFYFTNAAGENLFDPESPAYAGKHNFYCKIYMENSYEFPNNEIHSPIFINYLDSMTETEGKDYYVSYELGQQFRNTKLSESLTLERMWLKFLLCFYDGTTYEVLAKIVRYGKRSYAMGVEKLYVNGELKFEGNPRHCDEVLIPIIKE